MKMLASLAAGLGLLVLPAAAQGEAQRLAPPVNVLQPQAAPAPVEGEKVTQRQSMVIEEDGTVRFLTPQEAASLFIPPGATSTFNVRLEQSDSGSDSLHIEVTGAEITESVTSDGGTRVLHGRRTGTVADWQERF